MSKTDRRIEHTKHSIKTAFLTLLRTKTFQQISVKELCEKAEINRATFYAHYASLPDLMEEIEYEECKQLFDILDEVIVDTDHLYRSILVLIRYLREHTVLREIFLASNSSSTSLNRLTQERLKKSIKTITRSGNLNDRQATWILNFIVYGLRELLRQWFSNNEGTEEEFAFTLSSFISHGIFGVTSHLL